MVFGMHSRTKELADVFAEDSDNDKTFYGFSEGELSDHDKILDLEDEDGELSDHKPTKQEPASSEPVQPFKLRVALRCFNRQASDEEKDDEDAGKPTTQNKVRKKAATVDLAKKDKHEEEVVSRCSHLKGNVSDSAEEESFLARRERNIKANKAMLAQLMADLQKMPGGAGLLKKQANKQPVEKSSRPTCSGGEPRKTPGRASRRQTRSMGLNEDSQAPQETELEYTLEEELMEVRQGAQRRGTPRPNQSRPHIIRPTEDITEEELQLVADNMTEKVYNRVMGSTCHQCRQKTIDTKTCCRNKDCRGIQGQFCGPCLRNRYGEDVKKALLDPEWHCPPCRGICNCSFCRQREGRCPTGILFPLAQYHGFSNVHSYLSSLQNKLKSEDDVEV